MKKNINLDKSHDIKNLAVLNYLHGYNYAVEILAETLEYSFENISVGNEIVIGLPTHVHLKLSNHSSGNVHPFFVNYSGDRELALRPSLETGLKDYTLAIRNSIRGHLANIRRANVDIKPFLKQEGYHVLGFVSFLKKNNSFKIIKENRDFTDFCEFYRKEFTRKLSSCFSDLDTTKVEYSEEKDRVLNEESPWVILGLPINVSKEECDKVCRNLSKKYHPDIGGGHDVFAKISHARDLLEDYVF